MLGQVLVERELCVDLDQPLSRVLVVVKLGAETLEQILYFLFRTQTVASRAHGRATGGGWMMMGMIRGGKDKRAGGRAAPGLFHFLPLHLHVTRSKARVSYVRDRQHCVPLPDKLSVLQSDPPAK